jgi:D-inositol-3-phosphate glycosyltransferase
MTSSELAPPAVKEQAAAGSKLERKARISVLTGGFDRPYAYGVAMALSNSGTPIDVVGSDDVDGPEMHQTPGLKFFNLQPDWRQNVSTSKKVLRMLRFYLRLFQYVAGADSKIFHVLWTHRLVFLERTFVTLFYKMMGKRVVLTAHNVNTAKRDGTDTLINRLTLKMHYHLMDHIFVHTRKCEGELIQDFGVPASKISVIPFGINNSVPDTALTPGEARQALGLRAEDRVILFFGRIQPYKGLEYLVAAVEQLLSQGGSYKLLIAGEPKKEHRSYWQDIEQRIRQGLLNDHTLQHIRFIPDSDAEIYFKAADVTILPYRNIYQSGVLFLAYNFGLPVIATDVGSFREEIVTGETGFLARSNEPDDLAQMIEAYFKSDLYQGLSAARPKIQQYARERYSWDRVAEITQRIYSRLDPRA